MPGFCFAHPGYACWHSCEVGDLPQIETNARSKALNMTVIIVSVPYFDAAAQKIIDIWQDAGSSNLIRIEGFDGVGKSGLAALLRERLHAEHIEGDNFVSKPDAPLSYQKCVRQTELDHAIERAMSGGCVVILDAVCLEEVAPSEKWGRGFVVYVKRLSFNNADPIWHEGLNLEDELPVSEVRRSIHLYHNKIRPHETPDLIVELPEEGHSMTRGNFSRDRCFDPQGSEVVEFK